MKDDEKGYIVVETTLSFVLLILLAFSILTLVNISVVQAKVHTAITETANTISMYSYVLNVTGADQKIEGIHAKGRSIDGKVDELENNINSLINGINTLNVEQMSEGAGATANIVTDLSGEIQENPMVILDYMLHKGSEVIEQEVVKSLVEMHLTTNTIDGETLTGDEYLKSFDVIDGIDGLNFSETEFLTNGDIKIVVNYNIKYEFGNLPLPFDPKLNITQSAKTKLWLGGRGEGYGYEQ